MSGFQGVGILVVLAVGIVAILMWTGHVHIDVAVRVDEHDEPAEAPAATEPPSWGRSLAVALAVGFALGWITARLFS